MSDVHNDDVKNLLDKNKIQHTEAVMYRTVTWPALLQMRLLIADMLVFFSPATRQCREEEFPLILTREIKILNKFSSTAGSQRYRTSS